MDLTKYKSSPYAENSPLRGDKNTTPLAAALRGVLGQEEPGSVLDPGTAQNKRINEGTNLASMLADLTPAKALAGAAAKGAMLAGALRRGGRPDLYLSHGADAANLLHKDGNILQELMHPSFAVTKGAPAPPWGDTILIPQLGKVDPRTSPTSLHNRDAYTPGYLNSEVQSLPSFATPRDIARARLKDRYKTYWMKGGLNVETPDAVLQTMRFPSFGAYEHHPRGGDALIDQLTQAHPEHTQNISGAKLKELKEKMMLWGEKKLPGFTTDTDGLPFDNKLALLAQAVPDEDKHKVYGIIKALRNTPSDYAEAKMFGPFQLSPDNFAGALIKEGNLSDELAFALENRNIRTDIVPEEIFTDPSYRAETADMWHRFGVPHGNSRTLPPLSLRQRAQGGFENPDFEDLINAMKKPL